MLLRSGIRKSFGDKNFQYIVEKGFRLRSFLNSNDKSIDQVCDKIEKLLVENKHFNFYLKEIATPS